MKKLLLTFALFTCVSIGHSQLYIGGTVGNSFYNQDLLDISGDSFKVKSNSLGWKAYAGYQLGFLGVEGGYRDLGTITDEVSGRSIESDVQGWDVAGTGTLNIGPIYASAKAGAFFYNGDYKIDQYEGSINGTNFLWGLGAGVNLGPIKAGLSWESLAMASDNTLSQLMLDIGIKFGGRD